MPTNTSMPCIALENGLDLRQLCTTGSDLHINNDLEEGDGFETEREDARTFDHIGQPVKCVKTLEQQLTPVDSDGCVKKKIIDQGGGFPLHEGCTVHIAYTGFWEDVEEPFDVRKMHKPLVVDLKDNDLLPGLQIAVNSMLVGEMSVFLLSYKVMFGEFGVPPRIKPKADCVFYIKLIKSILTPVEGDINYTEPNMFKRVFTQVTKLYSSGVTLHKSKNTVAAVNLFRKSIAMLHKCRLADEEEEKKQEKMLVKLYLNLAICSNALEQPLKACIACNELNRLENLWNNSKALFQNAKALRMIGQYDAAKKRLLRAQKLCPDKNEIKEELLLLEKTRTICDQNKLIAKNFVHPSLELVSEDFKKEVDTLIKDFKENVNLCKLTLPGGLNAVEIKYVKEACVRENLFCSRIEKDFALDKTNEKENDEGEEPLDLSVSPDSNTSES
ncbi:inactive peptidyl-prolyl cis-trans isomerase shutdown-like [Cydia strobilella]|uniref:inactive peptidyl-prolyl cis-trans isomerase shutdown-like n=1 Tax=Cydia strobilella TaxID=1100964 RepID=UPI003004FE5B